MVATRTLNFFPIRICATLHGISWGFHESFVISLCNVEHFSENKLFENPYTYGFNLSSEVAITTVILLLQLILQHIGL